MATQQRKIKVQNQESIFQQRKTYPPVKFQSMGFLMMIITKTEPTIRFDTHCKAGGFPEAVLHKHFLQA